MIEFVIYALLATFIFSRLYNSLGRSVSLKKITGILDAAQSSRNEVETLEENITDYVDDHNKGEMEIVYAQLIKKSKDFSISQFIKGASMTFELIIKYLNKGNLEQLKYLVDKKLFEDFEKRVEHRKMLGEIHESVIVSVVLQKIVDLKLVKNTAFISVCFFSEQINFVKDSTENITSGSTSKINKIEDVWQFKKNINSSNPTWLLTCINYKSI